MVFWFGTALFVAVALLGPIELQRFAWLPAIASVFLATLLTRAALQYERTLKAYHSIEKLRDLAPSSFEQFVGLLLLQNGFDRVQVCGGASDRGVDIVAHRSGRKVVVQCKRYARCRKVSSPEMQTFIGAMKISDTKDGVFVTTSTFTHEARAIANIARVELIDAEKLAAMSKSTKGKFRFHEGFATH